MLLFNQSLADASVVVADLPKNGYKSAHFGVGTHKEQQGDTLNGVNISRNDEVRLLPSADFSIVNHQIKQEVVVVASGHQSSGNSL